MKTFREQAFIIKHVLNVVSDQALLQMVQTLMKENEELKQRVSILEQILHMHLPIVEEN
jgi:Trp operon repressor